SLLEKAIKAGKITKGMQSDLEEITRAEYIRTLINGEQVVINRAYIYNSEVIYRDYLPTKNSSDSDEVQRAQASREAFKTLLQDNVVVPYLFTENSPVQPPKFKTLSFEEWTRICQEVRVQCVRLSWDDDLNDENTDT